MTTAETYGWNPDEGYLSHELFSEIKKIQAFYEGLSNTGYLFCPMGTREALNYASYIYTSLLGTLDSIKTLLMIGRINDAYTLVRKYFDDVLAEIYIDVIRKDKYDGMDNPTVIEVDEWLRKKHRIPQLRKLLSILEKSDSTKDIYPFFGWNTYFKHTREFLDDSVHSNRYSYILLNCNTIYIPNREQHLENSLIALKHVFTMHLAFIFHLNPQYMMSSDYTDYLDLGETPPKGSEYWIAPYAKDAFDRYIKPFPQLATFIINSCSLDIDKYENNNDDI